VAAKVAAEVGAVHEKIAALAALFAGPVANPSHDKHP